MRTANYTTLAMVLAFGACAPQSSPLPEGYAGPVAHIADSISFGDYSSSDFFVVDKIGGRAQENALSKSEDATYGQGLALHQVPYARDVQPQQTVFSLLGRTYYAAPILALTNHVYQVKGDITFTPEAGRSYVVKGVLAKDGSAVWIEDDKGQIMDHKITKSDAALGILEK